MTNKRKIYLELFNLNETSSLDDVKKRYRELAKEFHPDRNKDSNAHERFLLIKEAYEYLITNQVQNSQTVYFDNINLEKERIEKIRIAKEKLKEYYRRKEIQKAKEINFFFKSRIWKLFKFLSVLCLAYSLLNIVDYILPKKEIKTFVSEISENYNSITEEQIVLIKPKDGKEFFILNSIKNYLKYNDSINIKESKILNKVYKVEVHNYQEKSFFQTPNNSFIFFVSTSLFLFIPALFYRKTNRNIEAIFFTKIILSIFIPAILYLILNYFF